MGAYEALWDEDGASFKTIYEKLSRRPDTVPSDLVEPSRVERYRLLVRRGDGKGECFALRGEGVCARPQQKPAPTASGSTGFVVSQISFPCPPARTSIDHLTP